MTANMLQLSYHQTSPFSLNVNSGTFGAGSSYPLSPNDITQVSNGVSVSQNSVFENVCGVLYVQP